MTCFRTKRAMTCFMKSRRPLSVVPCKPLCGLFRIRGNSDDLCVGRRSQASTHGLAGSASLQPRMRRPVHAACFRRDSLPQGGLVLDKLGFDTRGLFRGRQGWVRSPTRNSLGGYRPPSHRSRRIRSRRENVSRSISSTRDSYRLAPRSDVDAFCQILWARKHSTTWSSPKEQIRG